jgi:hypothetical protein
LRIEVDDAGTTAFAPAGTRPTNFPAAAATRYDIPRRRVGSNPGNEVMAFAITPDIRRIALKTAVSATVRTSASYGTAVLHATSLTASGE